VCVCMSERERGKESVKEDMVFRTGGCQRQNGDDDKCISTGSTAAAGSSSGVKGDGSSI